tara:strand:+ start:248 stop:394 length:147 start_codon:yes stop_codon:yes gene_type:complete
MKALKGNLAKIILSDEKGKIAMKEFIASGEYSAIITLSNGKSYRVFNK